MSNREPFTELVGILFVDRPRHLIPGRVSCETSSPASGSGYATAVSGAPNILAVLAKIGISFGVKEQILTWGQILGGVSNPLCSR